jgi:hypothetical protein
MARHRQGHISPAFRVSALPIADVIFYSAPDHCTAYFRKEDATLPVTGLGSALGSGLELSFWGPHVRAEKEN